MELLGAVPIVVFVAFFGFHFRLLAMVLLSLLTLLGLLVPAGSALSVEDNVSWCLLFVVAHVYSRQGWGVWQMGRKWARRLWESQRALRSTMPGVGQLLVLRLS